MRQHRASVGKKVTARILPHPPSTSSSLNPLSSQIPSLRLDLGSHGDEPIQSGSHHVHENNNINTNNQGASRSLFAQVFNWLRHERSRRKKHASSTSQAAEYTQSSTGGLDGAASTRQERRDSQTSQGSQALDELERILAQYSSTSAKEGNHPTTADVRKGSLSSKRTTGIKGLRRGSISDSDFAEAEPSVPSADVVLDNTKTLPGVGSELDGDATKSRPKGPDHWLAFKSEILRLTHTLGFKGWKRVPLEAGGDIDVIRLSGALTNAVYVVSPPQNIPPPTNKNSFSSRRTPS